MNLTHVSNPTAWELNDKRLVTFEIDCSCMIFLAPKLIQPPNSLVPSEFSRNTAMETFVPDCGLSLISLKFKIYKSFRKFAKPQ